MSGLTNYPTALDDDSSLINVTDTVTPIIAAHHNNLKEAVKALQAKLGIYNGNASLAVDYRLGHPSFGHVHDGASGQSRKIPVRQIVPWYHRGSLASGASAASPLSIGRNLQLESISARMRRAPSGATTVLDINFGASSLFAASAGLRPMFGPGVYTFDSASPNLVSYPSGALITVDVDTVGSNEPGQDVSVTFIFRDYT